MMTAEQARVVLCSGILPPNCAHKAYYPTREEAERIANMRAVVTGWKLHTYRCPDCGDWHLTKRPQFAGGRA